MKSYSTKRCVFCLAPATSYAGHVHPSHRCDPVVLAGRCRAHSVSGAPIGARKKGCKNPVGCLGGYDKRYGKQEDVDL